LHNSWSINSPTFFGSISSREMSYYYEWSMQKLQETLDELEHMILLIDKKKLRT
jgi:hypothetical protein